jgi:AraC-like DNA-binding protein
MTAVDRYESERLRWELATRAAPPPLRPYVRSYTGYSEWSAAPLRRREVPSGDVTLILSPDSDLHIDDPSRRPVRATSFIAALHDAYAVVEHGGRQRGIELRLTPLGAHALFGVPMHELSNRVVELDAVVGAAAEELVERLWDVDGWERRFAIVDQAIARRAAEVRPPAPELSWAWGTLRASAGRASIGALAHELGWSHRRLIDRFREQVGLPPKTLARILRFERVSRLLLETDAPRLAEVAHGCGYYDQAHLNRDFRDFAGTTPSDYLARRLPPGGGVAAT